MRTISERVLNDLAGAQVGCGLEASVWYDGRHQMDLNIDHWSIAWVGGRDVPGELRLTATGIDPAQVPWRYSDPLNVGGGRIEARYLHANHNERTPLGLWPITRSHPHESWHIPTIINGKSIEFAPVERWHPDYGTVELTANDVFKTILRDRFETVEGPKAGSVFAEIRRLIDGVTTLGTTTGVTDRNVPAGITYESTRIEAINTLADLVGAFTRMNEYGLIDLIPTTPQEPAWTIQPGPDGAQIDFDREFDIEDIYNGVVSTGRADESNENIVRYMHEPGGDLKWGGPAWRAPYFHQSIATTPAAVEADARTRLSNLIRDRIAPITITCVPNPALEIGDYVRLITPAGDLTGPLREIQLSGSTSGVEPMKLVISVPLDNLSAVSEGLHRMRQ